jgi:hypothetical protein
MTKRNRIKEQTMIYKTLLRSIKIEQQVPHQKKTRLNSGRVSRSSSTSVNYSNWYCWNIFILYQSSRCVIPISRGWNSGTILILQHVHSTGSPRNENLNLLVWFKFLNLFLYRWAVLKLWPKIGIKICILFQQIYIKMVTKL